MLQITERIENKDILRIMPCGELDFKNASELETYIFDRIDKFSTLILDMQEIPYISSAGIRVILKTDLEMKSRGQFILDNLNDTVYEAIKLVNFQEFLKINRQSDDSIEKEEAEKVSCYIKSYELSADELGDIPEIVSAYYMDAGNECLKIYKSDDTHMAYAFTRQNEAAISAFILIRLDNIYSLEYIVKCLEEYYLDKGVKEIGLSFFSADIEGNDHCLKQNQYEKYKKTYNIIYKMKNLLESKLFIKMDDSVAELTNVKNYNNLTDSQRMMLMFNYGISSRNDIDIVFSSFYVLDDEVKGTLLAKEVKENYLLVYGINATAEENTKLAIPYMIASFLNVCRTFLNDEAKICFVFESEKQSMGVAKVLGEQDSYDVLTEYKKYL